MTFRDLRLVTHRQHLLATLAFAFALSACSVPQPYRGPQPPAPIPPTQEPPVQTQPAPQPEAPVEEPVPPPAPVIKEPVLSPASRALVGQAQTQLASKNYAVAASSLERALRIEPYNSLLWIELGKVRQAEQNYVQAANMGRKAAALSANAPKANSAAWTLVAEALRAQGKNVEAREAQMRAQGIR